MSVVPVTPGDVKAIQETVDGIKNEVGEIKSGLAVITGRFDDFLVYNRDMSTDIKELLVTTTQLKESHTAILADKTNQAGISNTRLMAIASVVSAVITAVYTHFT